MKVQRQRRRGMNATFETASGGGGGTALQTKPSPAQPIDVQMRQANDYGHSLSAVPIQPALAVGTPGDKYEQEADAVAAQAVADKQASQAGGIQAKADSSTGVETPIQKKSEGEQSQPQRVTSASALDTQLAPSVDLPDMGSIGGDVSSPTPDLGGGAAPDMSGGASPDVGSGDMAADLGGGGATGGGVEAAVPGEATDMLGGEAGALTDMMGGGALDAATPSAGGEGDLSNEELAVTGDILSPEAKDQIGEAVGDDESTSSDSTDDASAFSIDDSGEGMASLEERILDAMGSGGQSPTEEEQSSLNTFVGIEDPGSIEIHDDEEAYQLCRELGALAFTTENHIFFGDGQRGDDELLFHEAWHTIQQGATDLGVCPGSGETAEDDESQPIVIESEEADTLLAAKTDPGANSGLLVQRAEDGQSEEEERAAEEKQKEESGAQADNAEKQGGEQGDAAADGAGSAQEDGAGAAQDAIGAAAGLTADEGAEGQGIEAAPTLDPASLVNMIDLPGAGPEAEADLDVLDGELDIEEPDLDPIDYAWVETQPDEVPEWDEELSNYSFFSEISEAGEPEVPVDREELIGDAVGQGLVTGAVDGGFGAVTAIGVGKLVDATELPVINNALATFTVFNQIAGGESWYNALAGGKWGDDLSSIGDAVTGLGSARTPWEAMANMFAFTIGITNLVMKAVQTIWNLVNIAAMVCFTVYGVLRIISALLNVIGTFVLQLIGNILLSIGNALLPLPFGVGIAPGTALITTGTTLTVNGSVMLANANGVLEPLAQTFYGFYETLNKTFLPPLSMALTSLQALSAMLNFMYMQALVLDILTCEGSIEDLTDKQEKLKGATYSMTTNAIAVGTELAAQKTQGDGKVGNTDTTVKSTDSGGLEMANNTFAAGGENAWVAQLEADNNEWIGDVPGGDKISEMAGDKKGLLFGGIPGGDMLSEGVTAVEEIPVYSSTKVKANERWGQKTDGSYEKVTDDKVGDFDGEIVIEKDEWSPDDELLFSMGLKDDAESQQVKEINDALAEGSQQAWLVHYAGSEEVAAGYNSAAALYDALDEVGEAPEPPLDAPERVDAAAFAMTSNEEERVQLEALIERTEEEREIMEENEAANEAAQGTVAAHRAAIEAYQQDIEERQESNNQLDTVAQKGGLLAAQYTAMMSVYWPLLVPINLAYFFAGAIQGENNKADETSGDNAINMDGTEQAEPGKNVEGQAGEQQSAGDNMASGSEASSNLSAERIAKLDAAKADAAEQDAELEATQAEFEAQQEEEAEGREALEERQALAEEELGGSEDNIDELMGDRDEAIGEAQDWESEFGDFYDSVMQSLGWEDEEEPDATDSESEDAGDLIELSEEASEDSDDGGGEADLSGANLTGADLSEADLSNLDLSDAILSNALLVSVNLSGADLSGADLSGADLSNADLSGADLSDADLSDAKLVGVSFA